MTVKVEFNMTKFKKYKKLMRKFSQNNSYLKWVL
jgi:hypothetical protein